VFSIESITFTPRATLGQSNPIKIRRNFDEIRAKANITPQIKALLEWLFCQKTIFNGIIKRFGYVIKVI